MDNLKKKIQNHNIKVQKAAIGEEEFNGNDQAVIEEDWDPCNCQGGPQNCPLQGICQLEGENVVYVCTVTRQDTFIQEKYCGSTQWFKTRWYQHNGNERHWKNRNKTSLAGYIWRLKTFKGKVKVKPLTLSLESVGYVLKKSFIFSTIQKQAP